VESRTWTEPSRGASALNFTETTVYNNSGTNYGTVQKITRSGGSGAELEFWENTPTYDALQRVTSSATRMQVGQNLPVTLTQSTAASSRSPIPPAPSTARRCRSTNATTRSACSICALSLRYMSAVREGFAADYNASQPDASPALRTLDLMDARGLVIQERLGVQANNLFDWSVRH
jgi:hypothetical protein